MSEELITQKPEKTVLERLRQHREMLVAAGAVAVSSMVLGASVARGERHVQPIKPGKAVAQFIQSHDYYFKEMKLDSHKIENKEAFKAWVQDQLQNNQRVAEFGKTPDQMDSKELVQAAGLITAENLKYSWDQDANAATDRQPMDNILMEHLPAECETYVATQQAVFGVMKEMFPSQLANTYLVEHEVDGAVSHFVNAVVELQSPNAVSVYFSDPTAMDPDWKHPAHALKEAVDSTPLAQELQKQGVEVNS